MKKLLFFTIIFSFFSCASVITTPAELTTEKVIENLKGNKTELYIKANDWMVDTFTNAESAIEFSDKENGILLGKYLLDGAILHSRYITQDNRVFAKIDIRIKDNSVKIKINPTTNIKTTYKVTAQKFKIEIEELITNFETRMNKEEKDW